MHLNDIGFVLPNCEKNLQVSWCLHLCSWMSWSKKSIFHYTKWQFQFHVFTDRPYLPRGLWAFIGKSVIMWTLPLGQDGCAMSCQKITYYCKWQRFLHAGLFSLQNVRDCHYYSDTLLQHCKLKQIVLSNILCFPQNRAWSISAASILLWSKFGILQVIGACLRTKMFTI